MNYVQKLSLLFFIPIIVTSFSYSVQQETADHKQEQEFHDRVVRAHPELAEEGVEAYYKKIMPITSEPDVGIDRWLCKSVSIDDKETDLGTNGMYMQGDISFKMNTRDIDSGNNFTIEVMHNGKSTPVTFTKSIEKKILSMPRFDSYSDIVTAARNNKLWFNRKTTFKGRLRIPEQGPLIILIIGESQMKKPATIQGMEIVYNKGEENTKVFLDFVDHNNNSADYLTSIDLNHSTVIADSSVVCIQNHTIFECQGKRIHGIFPSVQARKDWIPDETGFYDQNRHVVAILPSCYGEDEDHPEVPKDPMVWVLGEDENHDSFYQREGAEVLKDSNDYIYCSEGSFFLTLPYKATYKKYLSNNDQVEFDYLSKVNSSPLSIDREAIIVGGHKAWPTGMYQRIRNQDNGSFLKRVENSSPYLIEFRTEEIPFHLELYNNESQQGKQWCDAAQRFMISFPVGFRYCNRDVLHGFQSWNKLTGLHLSGAKLEGGLKWGKDVFPVIASMKQLTALDISNCNPTNSFFNESHDTLANNAMNYYCALAQCLNKLKKLKRLYIQGLWLMPRRHLGAGVGGGIITDVSTEVATLTGIINHKDQVGVKAIMDSIAGLEQLEELSVDGIPEKGSSQYARATDFDKFVLSPLFVITTPFQRNDAAAQTKNLGLLSWESAGKIAKMPNLKKVFVYAPEGNCADYFSSDFISRIKSRRDHENKGLPALEIDQRLG